jgi:hypothetical protein
MILILITGKVTLGSNEYNFRPEMATINFWTLWCKKLLAILLEKLMKETETNYNC